MTLGAVHRFSTSINSRVDAKLFCVKSRYTFTRGMLRTSISTGIMLAIRFKSSIILKNQFMRSWTTCVNLGPNPLGNLGFIDSCRVIN